MKQKEMSIESLRGLAIILMVAGHVIGHKNTVGMKIEDDSLFRYFYYSLQYLRMPLFTVISGYVYSMRPFLAGSSFLNFFRGKARRLLIPLISVGTLQFLFRAFIPGINNTVELKNIWEIYFFGFDQFWFLQSIFLIFSTIVLIENFKLMETFRNWFILLLLTIVARIFIPTINLNIFSINGYFLLLPFFVLGCGLKRYHHQIFKQSYMLLCFIIFVITFLLLQIQWFFPLLKYIMMLKIITLLVGISGITILFKYRFNQPYLAYFGYYAFSIYLFHVFGTVATRLFFEQIFPESSSLLIFVFSLFFGLSIPIFLDLNIMKFELTRNIIIGSFTKTKLSQQNSRKAA